MKEIVSIDQAIGGDGGKISAALGVSGDQLAAQVMVTYPIAKILEPATEAFDSAIDTITAKIPGTWDDELGASAKAAFKAKLVELLGEKVASVEG